MSSAAAVRDKVQRILVEEMDVEARLIPDGFQVPYASTAVNIRVIEQGDGEPSARVLVSLSAPTLRHVKASPELFEWIATEGGTYFFGHAIWTQYSDEPGLGIVTFEHTLLGDFLDTAELAGALVALANTSDDLDDELQKRFGGKRFVDPEE